MIKIDEKKYFEFFGKLIEKNLLLNFHFLKDFESFTVKEKQVEHIIVEVKLDGNDDEGGVYSLLVEDLPFNFLLSYTLLVGDRAELFEFEFDLDNRRKYITNKKVLEKLKDKINPKTLKEFDSWRLDGKKFSYNFKDEISVFKEYKRFIKKTKNINLDEIQVVEESSYFGNFTPNSDITHYEMLKEAQIPVCNLIDFNNFIIETTINIFDDLSCKNLLKIIHSFNEKKEIFYFNGSEVRNFIDEGYFLKVDFARIEKVLSFVKVFNFNKSKVLEEIKKVKYIKISRKLNEDLTGIPIPVFHQREIGEGEFYYIKDVNRFEKLSGVAFRSDYEFLKNLVLLNLEGEKLSFKRFFLDDKFTSVFFENHKEGKEIEFLGIDELILFLMFYETDYISLIKKKEVLSESKINCLKRLAEKQIDRLISQVIQLNCIPKQIPDESILNDFLSQKVRVFKKLQDDYNNFPSLNSLFKKTFFNLSFVEKMIRDVSFEKENLYSYAQICLVLIDCVNIFDKSFAQKLLSKTDEYFKIERDFNLSFNEGLSDFFVDLVYLNSYRRKSFAGRVLVILKKEEDSNSNFNFSSNFDIGGVKSLELKKLTQTSYSYIFVPRFEKIKEVFKYNYKSVLKKLRELNSQEKYKDKKDIEEVKIIVDRKEYSLNLEYFRRIVSYKNFRLLRSGKVFDIVLKGFEEKKKETKERRGDDK